MLTIEVPFPDSDPSRCRVLFGSKNLFVFHHPKELEAMQASGEKPQNITYDFAQGEIASSSGFDMATEGKSKEDILLQEDLISMVPMVYEANAMSEELNKKVRWSHSDVTILN